MLCRVCRSHVQDGDHGHALCRLLPQQGPHGQARARARHGRYSTRMMPASYPMRAAHLIPSVRHAPLWYRGDEPTLERMYALLGLGLGSMIEWIRMRRLVRVCGCSYRGRHHASLRCEPRGQVPPRACTWPSRFVVVCHAPLRDDAHQEGMLKIKAMLAGLPAADEFLELWLEVSFLPPPPIPSPASWAARIVRVRVGYLLGFRWTHTCAAVRERGDARGAGGGADRQVRHVPPSARVRDLYV